MLVFRREGSTSFLEQRSTFQRRRSGASPSVGGEQRHRLRDRGGRRGGTFGRRRGERAPWARDLRRVTAALINDDLLLDMGPEVAAAARAYGLDLSAVRYALQTHHHTDHLYPRFLFTRNPYDAPTELPTLHWYAGREAIELVAHACEPPGLTAEVKAWLRLAVHPVAAGPYVVAAVKATHGPVDGTALLFVVGDHRRTVFYATDTGVLSEAAWATLRADGRRFDLVALDESMGPTRTYAEHLNVGECVRHVARLRDKGLLAPHARIFAVHLLHDNPPHDELTTLLAPHGIEVAYDGLVVDV